MTDVRIIRKISGFRDGVEWPDPGGLLTVSDAEADDLEAIGIAERVSAKSTITPESAAAPAPETAAAPAPKPRARKS